MFEKMNIEVQEEKDKKVQPTLKKPRKQYLPEVKKICVKLMKKFSYNQITDELGIAKANLIRWNHEERLGILRMPRGRRVTYPCIEDHLLRWIRQERSKVGQKVDGRG